jgi:hypothetical protein
LPEQDAASTLECSGISERTKAESEGLAPNGSRCGRVERDNAQAGEVVGVSISMDEQKCAVASVGWPHVEQFRRVSDQSCGSPSGSVDEKTRTHRVCREIGWVGSAFERGEMTSFGIRAGRNSFEGQ